MKLTTTNDRTRDGKRWNLVRLHLEGETIGAVRQNPETGLFEGLVLRGSNPSPVYTGTDKQQAAWEVVDAHLRSKVGREQALVLRQAVSNPRYQEAA